MLIQTIIEFLFDEQTLLMRLLHINLFIIIDNNNDNRYMNWRSQVRPLLWKYEKYDRKFFNWSTRYSVSAATQYEKHPLSRFISYSLDFYEIVNHALWYYYIAYLVYCYCYVTTTIRNATRFSIFTSTFLYLSSSLHMKNIVIKYHKVKFLYEFFFCQKEEISNHDAWLLNS